MDTLKLSKAQIQSVTRAERAMVEAGGLFAPCKGLEPADLQWLLENKFLTEYGKLHTEFAGYNDYLILSEAGWLAAYELRRATAEWRREDRKWETFMEGESRRGKKS